MDECMPDSGGIVMPKGSASLERFRVERPPSFDPERYVE